MKIYFATHSFYDIYDQEGPFLHEEDAEEACKDLGKEYDVEEFEVYPDYETWRAEYS